MEPLNKVLAELRKWRQPTLMLVGNHDQVCLPAVLDYFLQMQRKVHVHDLSKIATDMSFEPRNARVCKVCFEST